MSVAALHADLFAVPADHVSALGSTATDVALDAGSESWMGAHEAPGALAGPEMAFPHPLDVLVLAVTLLAGLVEPTTLALLELHGAGLALFDHTVETW